MHAAIWQFTGDADDLLRRYDTLTAEFPTGALQLHVCLRAPDGMLLLDTCPSREAFQAFASNSDFRALRERHGLPEPTRLDDYPVHAAFAGGARVV